MQFSLFISSFHKLIIQSHHSAHVQKWYWAATWSILIVLCCCKHYSHRKFCFKKSIMTIYIYSKWDRTLKLPVTLYTTGNLSSCIIRFHFCPYQLNFITPLIVPFFSVANTQDIQLISLEILSAHYIDKTAAAKS